MWFAVTKGKFACLPDKSKKTPQFLQTGDLYLIPKRVPHTIWSTTNNCNFVSVHFTAHYLGSLPLFHMISVPPVYINLDSYSKQNRTLSHEFAIKTPGYLFKMGAIISTLLINILRIAKLSFDSGENETKIGKNLVRLEPALSYIEKNLDKSGLKIAEIADRLFISEVYLRKLFKISFQLSPGSYVTHRRIEKACALLRHSTNNIRIIAQLCGFYDAPFFHRTFRKYTGLTPKQYMRLDEV